MQYVSIFIKQEIFKDWIANLANVLRSLYVPPVTESINKNFLPSYKKLKDAVSIIDCSEIFIEQPKNLAAHTET